VSDDELIEEPNEDWIAAFSGALVFGEDAASNYAFSWPSLDQLEQLNNEVKLSTINYKTI